MRICCAMRISHGFMSRWHVMLQKCLLIRALLQYWSQNQFFLLLGIFWNQHWAKRKSCSLTMCGCKFRLSLLYKALDWKSGSSIPRICSRDRTMTDLALWPQQTNKLRHAEEYGFVCFGLLARQHYYLFKSDCLISSLYKVVGILWTNLSCSLL